jgi:Zn-dependent protease with chaperone function
MKRLAFASFHPEAIQVELVYPAGPVDVPAVLTAPSLRYRLHAWMALAGLLLFMGVYFALVGWFAWTAWRLFAGLANAPQAAFGFVIAGTGSAFLAVFLLKALVFIKRGSGSSGVEITAAEQPALFAFLHRLADEAGAPRPRRVYLSGGVNAAVFYDLSLVNLLIPSRKSLEIGLALVNVLSLGELKAVLAHELGHFAQRSMAVGSWVYIAQQVAGHIVARRDAFDSFLVRLSHFDLRIGWIGWLLRLIIWSLRSLLDLLFSVVVLAQRALAREMEFQADRVAVSVSGSDALVHALYRLGAADQAWDRAVDFANGELRAGRGVQDLFALQTRVISQMRRVLSDPGYGVVPPLPGAHPELHRLFKEVLAAPPKMWSTHPSNVDREANAKRAYVAAGIDERSAWTLFADPQALRERVSLHLAPKAPQPPAPLEETLARLDQEYARAFLDPAYRGVYLGRSIVRHAREVGELYGHPPATPVVPAALADLYPEPLTGLVEQLRGLTEEKGLLTALRAGFLTAPGGVILHRGEEVSRKALPRVIDSVEQECRSCESRLREHDQLCRTVHLSAAASLGEDWAAYLKGILQILHYADHLEANLHDAHGLLASTVNQATASGRVGKKARARVQSAADTAYAALKHFHGGVQSVTPDRTILQRLGVASWRESVEPLGLNPPTGANLGEWLSVVDSWMRSAGNNLSALRMAALDQLLLAEGTVARFVREGTKPAAAPPASQVPKDYRLLLPGTERPRNEMDWWDRFQTASGWLPGLARVAAAASIVAATIFFSLHLQASSLYVLNSLGAPVVVQVGGQRIEVPAFAHRSVDLGNGDLLHVVTRTTDGHLIEEFDAKVSGPGTREIYNVAGAGVLVSWQAAYGNAVPEPTRYLGAPRWSTTHAEVVFGTPPSSVSTKGGGATMNVLTGLGIERPQALIGALPDDASRQAVAAAHARWDAPDSRYMEVWTAYIAGSPDLPQIARERLKDDPGSTFNLRLEQLASTGAAHEAVCQRHRQMAASSPDNPELQYLAVRCIEDHKAQDQAFIELGRRWPDNPWVALGAGYTLAGQARWQEALILTDRARVGLPGFAELLSVESARMRRLLGAALPPHLPPLVDHLDLLQSVSSAELSDESATGMQRAYVLLGHGDLGGALAAAPFDSADAPRLLRLVAASEGASPGQIRQALDLPLEKGLDNDTLLPAMVTAAIAKRPLAPFNAVAQKILGPEAELLLKGFALLQEGAAPAQVDDAILGVEPVERGHLYVAAILLRGAACPRPWRLAAQRLLFVPEKPYLRSVE